MEVLPIIIYRFDSYVEPMHAVLYRTAGFEEIELICTFREQLKEYHHTTATRFPEYCERMTFEDRRSHFGRLHEHGHLRLDLSQDIKKQTGIPAIAYVRYQWKIPVRSGLRLSTGSTGLRGSVRPWLRGAGMDGRSREGQESGTRG